MLLNRDKLADVLGCTLRTVDEYVRQGMPGAAPIHKGDQWKFDSGECIDWLRGRERSSALGEVARIDEGEAKRRKLAAEAALAEHMLAEKQGAALAISDFEAAWAAMIGAARARMRGIGSKLGRVVALNMEPAECESEIDSAINEALQELSEFEPVQVESESAGELAASNEPPLQTVGAASEPDGKRMGRRRTSAKS